jgi:hypothetical protein
MVSKMTIGPFNGGYVLREDAWRVRPNEIIDGENITIRNDGTVGPRAGYIQYNKKENVGGPSYGLYAAYKSDGSRYFLRASGANIYCANTANYNKFEALLFGSNITLSSNQKTQFEVYNDMLYIVNGANAPMKWDFDTTHRIWLIGIVAPTQVATFSANTNGNLTISSTYYYKYQYYNSTNGTYSNASTVSAAMTTGNASNDGIVLDIPANSSLDPQVDQIRVYRTVANAAATSTFYLCGSTAYTGAATTFTDTYADTTIQAAGELDPYATPPASGPSLILTMGNRLFMGGGTYPNRLYFSRIGYPEYYVDENTGTAAYLNIGRSEGDKMIGIIEFDKRIAIFKESSIWILENPEDPFEVSVRLFNAERGLVSQECLCKGDNGIYFLSHDGWYWTNLYDMRKISGDLDPLFMGQGSKAISRRVLKDSAAIFHEDKLYFSYSSSHKTEAGYKVIEKVDNNTDISPNQKQATLNSGSGFSLTYDAALSLTETQSDQNGEIVVTITYNWGDFTKFDGQAVYAMLYVSYDNRATWKMKQPIYNYWQKRKNGMNYDWVKYPETTLYVKIYDFNITDIRLDYYKAEVILPLMEGWRAAGPGQYLASIELPRIQYYIGSTTESAVNDTTLVFHSNRTKPTNYENPMISEWRGVWDPPATYGTRCFASWSQGSDLNELFCGDSQNSNVYQLGVGENDNGHEILAFFQSGALDFKGEYLFESVTPVRFNTDGKFVIIVLIDGQEKIRKELSFSIIPVSFYNKGFAGVNYGGPVSIIRNQQHGAILPSGAEGKYIAVRIYGQAVDLGNIQNFEITAIKLEER